MKKLSLKMKGIGEMLTREQMKMVLGGDGFEGGGNGAYKCCPGPGNGTVQCSDCIVPPNGSTPSCTVGILTAC
jgi:hypothetical protein